MSSPTAPFQDAATETDASNSTPAFRQPAAESVPVTTTNPNCDGNHHGQREAWSSGHFGCFSNVSCCCLTCWCPCITFGRIATIVDKDTPRCATSGLIYTILASYLGCACIYLCTYRSKLRKQYMLEESPCNDCLVHRCCEGCALCQEYRELKRRGFDMSLGWEGNMK